jgi:5,10-methylenetetrahydromethanopterin reductase
MRLGITYTMEVAPVREVLKPTVQAEKIGFESAWAAEQYCFRDVAVVTSALASVTRKIKIGTNIINPYSRHPGLLAMTIATLDEFCGGRAILGLGTGNPRWMGQNLGIPLGKPLVAMREAVEIIREFLSGKQLDRSGRQYSVRGIGLGFKPPRSSIPIYMAAVRSGMLHLAGRIADGVILTGGSSASYAEYALREAAKGVEKAGAPKKFDTAAIINTSVDKNSHKAADRERPWVAYLVARWLSDPKVEELMLTKEGVNMKPFPEIRRLWEQGRKEEAMRIVPEDVIKAMTLSGTVRECERRLEDYLAAGLKLPILCPAETKLDSANVLGRSLLR